MQRFTKKNELKRFKRPYECIYDSENNRYRKINNTAWDNLNERFIDIGNIDQCWVCDN